MEDNIDLPEEYFNSQATSVKDIEDSSAYSLDVYDGQGLNKKTPEQQESVLEQPIEGSNNPAANKTIFKTENTNNIYNNNQANTYNESVTNEGVEQNKNTSNIVNTPNSDVVDRDVEDINYNFYKNTTNKNINVTPESISNQSLRPKPDDSSVLDQIQSIDKKIANLNSKLSNIDIQSKNTFNSVVEGGSSTSTVNNDYSLDSEPESPITVVPNLFYNEKQQIRNNIFTLNNQKNKLLSFLNTNSQNSNDSQNNNEYNSANNVTDNYNAEYNQSSIESDFSPNLINNTEKSLEKAVITEKILGGDPKIVDSPQLGKVVIDERQGTLENAVQEHGGLENAINDSKANQDLVENFLTQKSNNSEFISNLYEDNSKSLTLENLTPVDSVTSEPVPDNNQNIAKDTTSILSALGSITSTLLSISENISKLKLNNPTNNNKFAANFYSSDGKSNTNQPTSATQSKSNKAPINTGIKGNLPIADFFPKDFKVESLGVSNLLSRI